MPADPAEIRRIIEALTSQQISVSGPTSSKDGEQVYLVNEHKLTESELLTLAHENLLTTWGVFNFVRVRDQNRSR